MLGGMLSKTMRRVSVSRTGDRLDVSVRPVLSRGIVFMGVAALAVWVLTGLRMLSSPTPSSPGTAWGVVAFLALGAGLFVAAWSWLAAGREDLRVERGTVSISRRVLWRANRASYPLDACAELRPVTPFGYPWADYAASDSLPGGFKDPAGVIAFDADGKEVRFGDFLDKDEARTAIDALAEFIPVHDSALAAFEAVSPEEEFWQDESRRS